MKSISNIRHSQIFQDSFWALLGSTTGKGLSLVAGILVARFLTKEIYGEYGIIKNTLYYIAVFSTFGFGFTSTRFISKYRKVQSSNVVLVVKSTYYITFIISGLMSLILFLFSDKVAIFLEADHLDFSLRLSAIAIILNAIDTAQIGILSGLGAFKQNARNTAIAGVINFLASVGFTLIWGLNGAIIALILSYGASCCLNMYSINHQLKSFHSDYSYSREIQKEMLSFSFPIALQESLYSITHWATVAIFVKISNYGELALISAAGQWQAILLFIPGVLRNVTLSHLSGNTGNSVQHAKTVKIMLFVNFISTFSPFILLSFASNFISSFYGASFTDLPPVLILSTSVAVVNCVSNVYSQELMSRGKNWFLFWTRFVKDISILILVCFILSSFHLRGSLTMCVITIVIQSLYLLVLYFKYMNDLKRSFEND